jgi:hypothetical protein
MLQILIATSLVRLLVYGEPHRLVELTDLEERLSGNRMQLCTSSQFTPVSSSFCMRHTERRTLVDADLQRQDICKVGFA